MRRPGCPFPFSDVTAPAAPAQHTHEAAGGHAAPAVGARALAALAGPILVSQLAVLGLAVIDTVMAGRLSATDLAAVAVGMSIYASVFIGMNGVLQALTPIAGHHYGAGRWRDIGLDLAQGHWLALAMAALGMPVLLFPDPWLRYAGVDPAVATIARDYLLIIAFALPGSLLARSYIAVNSAVSRPNVAMTINLAMLAAKVPLNYLFMHGAGPLPALGGAGCALASAALLWGNAAANALVWRLDPFYDRFRLHRARFAWPDRARQKELLRLGLPSGATLLIEVTSFTFIAILVARLGAVTLGGHQILANLVSLLFMLPLSLGIATSVLVSQCLGAGAPRLARQVALRGWRIAVGAGLVAAALTWLAREPIIRAYTTDPAVIEFALALMTLAALFHAFDALQGVAGMILRGYKVAVVPMLIHSAALWGIGLVGGYLLAYHSRFGVDHGGATAFWAAAVVGLALAGIALTVLAERVSRGAITRAGSQVQ
jgi:multidrug resistance protein, MATE family